MQSSQLFVNSDVTLVNNSSNRKRLLDWYFLIKRKMPWRAEIGQEPNPYYVLVSEFMLQQTTVQTVIPYFERFIQKFPTLESLANASLDDVYALWQGLGYYSRAKNLHKACQQICEFGYFPKDIEKLKTLAGVGPYTSASISAIAFDNPTMPVDGNVMRVLSRLFTLPEPKGPKLHDLVQNCVSMFAAKKDNTHSAQALMELGALVCKPKNPLCNECPLSVECQAFKTNTIDLYPKLLAKAIKPKRIATAYVIINPLDQLLIEKRPDKGLFSNMFIFPTTCFEFDPISLPDLVIQKQYEKPIKHVFSHFDLQLTVIMASTKKITDGIWVSPHELSKYGMPTLMHKVVKVWEDFYKESTKNFH
ncbi:MAG: A/G-specific adenine glycosylase [Candidatus Paracaedibacteraceae bacterium]|nr:A/G-specific adenine glycosylase [Candidatus Paracaedibacteraceae bacterium]